MVGKILTMENFDIEGGSFFLTGLLLGASLALPWWKFGDAGDDTPVEYRYDGLRVPMLWKDQEHVKNRQMIFQVGFAMVLMCVLCLLFMVFLRHKLLRVILGSLSLGLLLIGVITFAAHLPEAFTKDVGACSGPCEKLSGSDGDRRWGVDGGWILAVIALPFLFVLVIRAFFIKNHSGPAGSNHYQNST